MKIVPRIVQLAETTYTKQLPKEKRKKMENVEVGLLLD